MRHYDIKKLTKAHVQSGKVEYLPFVSLARQGKFPADLADAPLDARLTFLRRFLAEYKGWGSLAATGPYESRGGPPQGQYKAYGLGAGGDTFVPVCSFAMGLTLRGVEIDGDGGGDIFLIFEDTEGLYQAQSKFLQASLCWGDQDTTTSLLECSRAWIDYEPAPYKGQHPGDRYQIVGIGHPLYPLIGAKVLAVWVAEFAEDLRVYYSLWSNGHIMAIGRYGGGLRVTISGEDNSGGDVEELLSIPPLVTQATTLAVSTVGLY